MQKSKFGGIVLVVAVVGRFKRRIWGWRLAVVIIVPQALGDLLNAFMRRVIEGAIGVVIAGALLANLLRPEVRTVAVNGNVSNAS